jgi:hypothetical protein
MMAPTAKKAAPGAAESKKGATRPAKAECTEVVLDAASRGGRAAEAPDMGGLRFAPPRSDTDEECLAKAFIMPGKTPLRLRVRGCLVTKVAESRKNSPTMFVRASGGSSLTAYAMALDDHVVQVAKTNIDAWFLHKMNADLVEEYYRGSTATDSTHGVVGRFVLSGRLPETLAVGASYDLTLHLVGVQFRRQYFTAVWTLLAHDAVEADQAPPAFFESSEEEDDEEDDDYAGPAGEEECAELRQAVTARLLAAECAQEERLHAVRDLIRVLDAAPLRDLRTLADVEERLEEVL